MKSINKWHIVLSIGIAAIAIPIAAHVGVSTISVLNEQQTHPSQQFVNKNEGTDVKRSSNDAKAVDHGVGSRQDYYDRRREYWEKRVERRLEYEDAYGEEPGDDAAKADAKDSKETKKEKDSKASKKDDDEDEIDQEAEMYERRREYWRERLDDEW